MISDSNQNRNAARIEASQADIHTLIATLEAQLKAGVPPTALGIQADQGSMPKTFALDREDSRVMDYEYWA
jgi:hypothetical protein